MEDEDRVVDGEVSAPDTVLEGLVKENQLFKSWIIGLVTKCEGCTEEATRWVESMEPLKQFKHPES
jgi:hypothetical protein